MPVPSRHRAERFIHQRPAPGLARGHSAAVRPAPLDGHRSCAGPADEHRIVPRLDAIVRADPEDTEQRPGVQARRPPAPPAAWPPASAAWNTGPGAHRSAARRTARRLPACPDRSGRPPPPGRRRRPATATSPAPAPPGPRTWRTHPIATGTRLPAPAGGWSREEPEGPGDRVRHEAVTGQYPRPAGAAADAVVGGIEVQVGTAVRHQVRRMPGGGEPFR